MNYPYYCNLGRNFPRVFVLNGMAVSLYNFDITLGSTKILVREFFDLFVVHDMYIYSWTQIGSKLLHSYKHSFSFIAFVINFFFF